MTTTLSPPIRILALVGVLAAAVLGIFLFTHNRSDSSSSAPAPSISPSQSRPATQHPLTVKPVTKPAVKPKIVLRRGLPAPIAHALRFSNVVVVALYAHGGLGDKAVVAQARAGAKSAHAGFAAVNVVDEKSARSLGAFAGTTTAPPAILLVKRPGKIVNQFSGSADSEIVAQAALNAGAGR